MFSPIAIYYVTTRFLTASFPATVFRDSGPWSVFRPYLTALFLCTPEFLEKRMKLEKTRGLGMLVPLMAMVVLGRARVGL
jgi:hypothetical protein